MPSLKERGTAKVRRFRDRHPFVDHVASTVTHYNAVNGNAQAGAVTFFGFLSFFPILALAFFSVGVLSGVYPDLRYDIRVEIDNLLPGVIGNEPGEIRMKAFEDYAGRIGVIGLVGLLYSGLGWLSGMRTALETLFVMPRREQPNFVVGKAIDVSALVVIGLTLIVSVALSGLVAGFSERLLTWVGVDPDSMVPTAMLWLVGHGLAIAASTALLLTMFRLLGQPHVPRRSLLGGAVVGAIGFELLKGAANFLIGQTKEQPAFQAFGVALILVVWINYFSRLVMYAAAFAYTSREAAELRAREAMRAPAAAISNGDEVAVSGGAAATGATEAEGRDAPARRSRRLPAALLSTAAVLGGAAVVARRRSED